MSKITTIPAGKEIRLSQEIYYYMLMQVPQGRLTRDCDIREYLNELYGTSYIDFDILATLRTMPGYHEYMTRIVERVPKHRLVSTQGYVSDGLCIEKLQAEGLIVTSNYLATNRDRRRCDRKVTPFFCVRRLILQYWVR